MKSTRGSRAPIATGALADSCDDLTNALFPMKLRQGGCLAHSSGKIDHTVNTGEGQREARLVVGKPWDHAKAIAPTPERPVGEVRNLTGGKLGSYEGGFHGATPPHRWKGRARRAAGRFESACEVSRKRAS